MKKRFQPALVAAVVLCAALAAPAQASCTWYVADTTTVTTYGYTNGPNGTVVQVPLYTTITLYWEADCQWDDPIYMPPPNDPHTAPFESRLFVENVRVDTVDPERPTITADVSSTYWRYPPAEVLLLINGYRQDAIYPNANGTYTFTFPAIRQFGDGMTEIAIEACDSESRCAIGNGQLMKSTPTALEASDTLHVWRMEGKSLVRYAYGHAFRQVYALTTFSVPETGENARYQLKENSVQLAWDDPIPGVFFDAQAQSQISIYPETMSLGWCSWGDPVCYAENCAAKCGYFGSYGVTAPTVTEWISTIVTHSFEPWQIYSGGQLTVQAP